MNKKVRSIYDRVDKTTSSNYGALDMEDSKRFKWWMEILLTNHTDKKVFVGGKIQMIKEALFILLK